MVEKRRNRRTSIRKYDLESEVLTAGQARERKLRRIGSAGETKPAPVFNPHLRREQEQDQVVSPRRQKRLSKPSGTIPVMARGGMESMASRRPRRPQPKRRFDISLRSLAADAPGAEVRLPAMPRLHVGWRLLSGSIVLMLIACLYMLWKSPAFHISDVQAFGLQRLTVADLSSAMAVSGDSAFFINTRELEETLQQLYPELSSVDVSIELPGTLTVNAVERQPLISWVQGSTETWIDADGVSFMPRGTPATALVQIKAQAAPPGSMPTQLAPVASSLADPTLATVPQMRIKPELVSAILALSSVAPENTLLLYNTDYGLGWNDKQHGWKVFFGSDVQEIQQKLIVYQALAVKLDAEGIQPELISVEFLHAPFYRMER